MIYIHPVFCGSDAVGEKVPLDSSRFPFVPLYSPTFLSDFPSKLLTDFAQVAGRSGSLLGGDEPGFGDFGIVDVVDGHEFYLAGTFGECAGDAFVIDDDVAHCDSVQKFGVKIRLLESGGEAFSQLS